MKYQGIRKIHEGKFITRYDVDYVTAEGRLTAADPEVTRTLRVEGEIIPIGDIVRIRIGEAGRRGKRLPR